MIFEAELDQSEWTLDDSIPIRIYGDRGNEEPEYIFEMPLNRIELLDLKNEVTKAIKELDKVTKRRNVYRRTRSSRR